jgi:hypothetical protein
MFPQVTELNPGRYTARGGVRVLVGPPVFKLCLRSSASFVGVCGLGALGATARHGPQSSAGVAVATAVSGRPTACPTGQDHPAQPTRTT